MTNSVLLLDLRQVDCVSDEGTRDLTSRNWKWALTLYYCQTKQNHEHLKYFGNVNWVMTNHSEDQDMQAGTLLLLVKFYQAWFIWLFPCNTIAFQRYFSCCPSVIPLSCPCKFSSIEFISYPLFYLVPLQGLGANAKVELLTEVNQDHSPQEIFESGFCEIPLNN